MTEEVKECKECGLSKPHSAFEKKSKVHYPRDPALPPKRRSWFHAKCRECNNRRRAGQRAGMRVLAEERDVLNRAPYDTYELPPVTALELVVLDGAACKGDYRFTNPGRGAHRNGVYESLRSLCETCPVRKECRQEGDRLEQTLPAGGTDDHWVVGFRAGESAPQRIERRKEARRALAA